MPHVTSKPIDLDELRHAVEDPSCGGHAIFVGKVRNLHRAKEVVRLEYEAYEPMTEKVLTEIEKEAEKHFGVKACHIVHRVGILEPGEISVVVAVASGHRKEAFAACEYAVDELKRRAPIWKKETYRDGRSEWLDGR